MATYSKTTLLSTSEFGYVENEGYDDYSGVSEIWDIDMDRAGLAYLSRGGVGPHGFYVSYDL
ncbi:hypothetical protein PHPALM_30091 [Phytophthora palmivora]|uniref:Uncharacterized protein n=1 Tax=Phytophthora palmivora TaxID=4796 RepID=A0A2P4X606_9STRA|nr:hypothetical protein PHPALM_30091 [Phytophthora palmivora]